MVTTRWKYLPHISAKASIYVTKRPSCHVLPEKYRQVTTARRCSAAHESRNYWRKTKMEEGRRIERKPRWNRRRGRRRRGEGGDRRRENAAIVPCSRHFRNRTVRRRRSQIDTTGKSRSVVFFFRKMRFRRGLGDDAKNCCGGRENGLSSLIGLPNGEIWRTSVCDFIACARRHFHIFENCRALIRFRRRTRLASSRDAFISRDGEICRKPFEVSSLLAHDRTLQISSLVDANILIDGQTTCAQ